MNGRHLARVLVRPEFLVTPRPGTALVVEGSDIPEGARVVNTGYDPAAHCFFVVLEHPSFPAAEEGRPVTQISGPTFRAAPAPPHEGRPAR